ncbi:MAG: hypothetical protein NTZ50_14100 [Chloroflexi bacterium]|nr:hypothetical protein [Chloroflexota bacterium]
MNEKFAKIFLATSLLLSVIGGAFTAWRMSVLDDAAGDAVNDAMHALITDASARIRSNNDTFERMRAYSDYRVALNAQEATLAEAKASTDPEAQQLYQEQAAADALPATVSKAYFDQRYALRDGSYNLRADQQSSYNKIVGRRSTDSGAFLTDSQESRDKTDRMVVFLIGYALVLLVATLSEEMAPVPATITAVIGIAISVGLIILTNLVEAGRLA